MKKLSLHLSSLLLLSLFFSASAKSLNETCTSATGFVPYNFCMKALNTDPRTKTARSTKTVALISLNLTLTNAISTKSKICTLLARVRNPALKNALQACDIIYSNAITDLNSAIDFLRSGKFETAKTLVTGASIVGNDCGAALKRAEMAIVGPDRQRLLKKENGDFGLLTLLFLGVINPLL
ncbi:hypothetical protein LUZ60_014343 [Juncus effusus]|nr:hypothetical protein LUZ60_014343 [Juncus effusus]